MKRALLTTGILILFSAISSAQISYDSLSAFLVKAKIATYASGDESKLIKTDEGAKEISYSDSSFIYRDRYYGEYNFTGEEIVWQNKKPVWSMNYFGFTFTSEKIPQQFPDFLKLALRQVNQAIPFRGPLSFNSDDFEYTNEINGDLKDFRGLEQIRYKGKSIFKLYYHGGIILY